MTPAERLAARALWGATFLPGSYDKRFSRDLAERAEQADAAPLTERQAACLWRLCHRYRRQLFRRTGSAPGMTVQQVRDHFEARARREGGMDTATPGCDKRCPGQERCLVGWPDGSCGAAPQGERWPPMTEEVWLSADLERLLHWLRRSHRSPGEPAFWLTDRQWRLWACALVRLCWERLTDERSRRAVDVAERYAEGEATEEERLRTAREHVAVPALERRTGDGYALATAVAWTIGGDSERLEFRVEQVLQWLRPFVSPAAAASLLRCVVGSPWRPVVLASTGQPCPRCYGKGTRKGKQGRRKRCRYCLGTGKAHPWLTYQDGLVPKLARGCYDRDNRLPSGLLDPGRLAVLADALEEAGVSEEVCGRCQGTGNDEADMERQLELDPHGSFELEVEPCPDCKGHGRIPSPILTHLRTETVVCGACGGSCSTQCPECGGDRIVMVPRDDLEDAIYERCFLCRGIGWVDCPACNGAGTLPAVHAVGCHVVDCILGKS